MIRTALVIVSCGVLLSIMPLRAETHGDYRDFALGSPLARVVAQTDAAVTDVARIHERPALIQQLRWRIPYLTAGTNEPRKDTVQQILFSFLDDQLFSIAVDYDRLRVEGMTDSDMVAALSERYGSPLTPLVSSKPLSPSVSSALVARWEQGDVAVVLLRNAFTDGFQLVVTSKRLDNLARVASAEAIKLDAVAAPALELARRQKDADNARDVKEKARVTNKGTFRP